MRVEETTRESTQGCRTYAMYGSRMQLLGSAAVRLGDSGAYVLVCNSKTEIVYTTFLEGNYLSKDAKYIRSKLQGVLDKFINTLKGYYLDGLNGYYGWLQVDSNNLTWLTSFNQWAGKSYNIGELFSGDFVQDAIRLADAFDNECVLGPAITFGTMRIDSVVDLYA